MRQGAPIRGILFDLFETLVTQPPTPPELHPGERLGCPDAFDEVWATSRHARMTSPIDFRELLTEACRRAAMEPDPLTIDELIADRRDRKAKDLTEVSPAIHDMLSQLRRRGIPTVVVSNCSVDEIEQWHTSPINALVSEAVFSCDCGVMKPDPAIYDIAIDRLGCDPASAVFVGDGGSDELRGAHEAGVGTVLRATWFVDQVEDRFGRLAPNDRTISRYPTITAPGLLIDRLESADRRSP